MLKCTILHTRQPLATNLLELSPEQLQDQGYRVGNSENCQIHLPQAKEVTGRLFCREGQFYFVDLVGQGRSQFNDENTHIGRSYCLGMDDIVRIGEYVLIIDESPHQGHIANRRRSRMAGPVPEADTASPMRSRQLLKSLAKKRSSAGDTAAMPVNIPIVVPEAIAPLEPTAIPLPIGVKPTLPQKLPRPKAAEPAVTVAAAAPPSPKSDLYWRKGKLRVRCVEIIDETRDVKTFRFLPHPRVLCTYLPGQFVTLHLSIDEQPVKRSYSISSTPSRPHLLEVTIKRVPPPADCPDAPPGLVSNWLHDRLQVGSEIEISGPHGKFTCGETPERDLLLISAGSGITPMMAMTRWVIDTGCDRQILFLHSARSQQDIIYHQELEILAERYPQLRLALTLTRPLPEEPWSGLTGRITPEMVQAIAPDFKARSVFVCGPEPFMAGVKSLFASLDYPMEHFQEESFGGTPKLKTETTPEKVSSPELPTVGQITFAQSQQETTTDGTVSILEIAEELGIEIDSGCRSGSCGSCKVKKLAGEIRYEGDPNALSPEEEEAGWCLSCIAHPVGKVQIEA